MADGDRRIGALVLQPGRELRRGDEVVAIGSRTLAVLSALADANGGLLTKDELIAAAWGRAIVEENTLHAQISAARKVLGVESARLVSVHGRGYRLECEQAQSASTAAPACSIAVLPFINRSHGGDDGFLADGMVDDLITSLAQAAGLKVSSRTSSFAYRDRAIDIRTIASELGVAFVLEGSVQIEDRRIHINVQLIEAESGFHRWSDTFDATLDALQPLLTRIAATTLKAIDLPADLDEADSHHPDAVRLVLIARGMSSLGTAETLERAAATAQEAARLDPTYARAWEALAGIRLVQAQNGQSDWGSLEDTRLIAERALLLDPRLGGPDAIIAVVAAAQADWIAAARHHENAMARNPFSPVLRDSHIFSVLLATGRSRAALTEAGQTIADAPNRPIGHYMRALAAWQSGAPAAAGCDFESALLLGLPHRPTVNFLRFELAFAANDADATQRWLTALMEQIEEPEPRAVAAALLAASGGSLQFAPERIQAVFARALERGALWRQSSVTGFLVRWLATSGAIDAACDCIARIAESWRATGWSLPGFLIPLWHPELEPLRRDSRFATFCTSLDLPAYWQRYGFPDAHVADSVHSAANLGSPSLRPASSRRIAR